MGRPEIKKVERQSASTSKGDYRVNRQDSKRFTRSLTAKMDEIALRNATESPLLRLPSEIRNRIYGYALGGQEVNPRTVGGVRTKWRLECRPYGSEARSYQAWDRLLSLTYVCRLLHRETRLLAFSLNTFQIQTVEFNDWLLLLNDDQKNAITTVIFGLRNPFLDLPYQDQIPPMLEQCAGLKTAIHVFLRDPSRIRDSTAQKFAKMKCLDFIVETKAKAELEADAEALDKIMTAAYYEDLEEYEQEMAEAEEEESTEEESTEEEDESEEDESA
ncbi:uncharacterized protein K460DRAFT_399468 [Cucurbitaria berberidis CBS 394.84]|uniref:Uncharacterized protein n=1 Tax=Cucurbitaria berberidis CBS 394.84 TaxID=1168544 RepID=A0A9P4G7W4_9PLEO|nr:uncharacterized protein K460DRAFT_399468 [Cucurbitaria berberidis CBS 394.84]KAF1840552.1 hypothetical protein K460DRAFT_399468 [Cucurbitaria berberidis CBS 394.84]